MLRDSLGEPRRRLVQRQALVLQVQTLGAAPGPLGLVAVFSDTLNIPLWSATTLPWMKRLSEVSEPTGPMYGHT